MSDERPGSAPADAVTGSWASESLPLSVRRELLQRELRKLRLRRAHPGASAQGGPSSQQQQETSPQRRQSTDAGEA